MVHDWVGGTSTVNQPSRRFDDLVNPYVDGMPHTSSEEHKARQRIKGVAITLAEDRENPGCYRASSEFVPHFQMEGMSITLSM